MADFNLSEQDKIWKEKLELARSGDVSAKAWLEADKELRLEHIEKVKSDTQALVDSRKQSFDAEVSHQKQNILYQQKSVELANLKKLSIASAMAMDSPGVNAVNSQIFALEAEMADMETPQQSQASPEDILALQVEYVEQTQLASSVTSADNILRAKKRMKQIENTLRFKVKLKMGR